MNTTTELKQLARDCGNHFFSPGAMRFFNSRVGAKVYRGRYFVTSEQYSEEPRRYTLRSFAYADGVLMIDTVGEFGQYATGRDAVPDMNWLFAYNFFRLAGILQGIKKRVIDGTASSAHAKEQSSRVQPLVDRATEFARKAGM